MNAYFNGEAMIGLRGPSGPDGNPVGAVISFMGTSAPKDYLVCDGAEYSVSEYPQLASFFQAQFGTPNHFGGDGETTFAVPDMRNLFLRGYHGEAEEQLSGNVGERQEATQFPSFEEFLSSTTQVSIHFMPPSVVSKNNQPANVDKVVEKATKGVGLSLNYGSAFDASNRQYGSLYTSRPVNMAILYCIKAVESAPAENVYSTEETRIGTWIDGKPLYRKVVSVIAPNALNSWRDTTADFPNIDAFFASTFNTNSSKFTDFTSIGFRVDNGKLQVILTADYRNQKITAICMYTKTTDGKE